MLTYQQLKALEPEEKWYAVTVSPGLQLRVFPSGKKTWHINKSVHGKRVIKDIGSFPDVSLAEAVKYTESLKYSKSEGSTLKDLYTEWLELKKKTIKNWKDIDLRFQKYILPILGRRSFKSINPSELIALLKASLETQNKLETIKRICIWFKQLEVFGVNYGYLDSLRFQGINQVFPTPRASHRKSIHPNELTNLFRLILLGSIKAHSSWLAVQIAFYTLLRPREYCSLEWSWVDMSKGIITIPAEHMKMKEEHIVPISSQLKELLNHMPKISKYVLPSSDKPNSPISISAMPIFLKRRGITNLQPHGIRSIGRTWMAENGIDDDIGELCLAHKIGSSVTRAYKRTSFLEKRTIAMQSWSDYIAKCINEASRSLELNTQRF